METKLRAALTIACAIGLSTLTSCGGTDDTSSDDLWAEALILSTTGETDTAKVIGLFVSAIEKAEARAPIYVSLGDYHSGPAAFAGELDAHRERYEERLAELCKKALTDLNEELGINIADAVAGMQKTSLEFYLAAAAEDPKYAPAWFRICTSSQVSENIRLGAIERLRECDPDNALPYFLSAVESCKAKDIASALKHVRKGNSRPRFGFLHPSVPSHPSLSFPETESCRKAGVAGKPVTLPFLETLGGLSDSFVQLPLYGGFRELGRGLVAEGERLEKKGNLDLAEDYYTATVEMGLKLVRTEPPEMIIALVGHAVVVLPKKQLSALYSRSGRREALERYAELETRLQKLNEKCMEMNEKTRNLSDEKLTKHLLSAGGGVRKERETLRQGRREAGLDDFSLR